MFLVLLSSFPLRRTDLILTEVDGHREVSVSLLVAVWKGVYARSEYFLCRHDEPFVNVYTYDNLYETNESTLFFGV